MAVSNSTDRFNGVLASKAIKVPVKRATAVNQTLSGDPGAIDGWVWSDGDRILLYGQTNPVENGIWEVNLSSSWTRAPDFDGTRDAIESTLITAGRSGSDNPLMYVLTTDADPIRIGTDALAFQVYFDPDVPATADLQGVTDVGATTTNEVFLNGGVQTNNMRYNAANAAGPDALITYWRETGPTQVWQLQMSSEADGNALQMFEVGDAIVTEWDTTYGFGIKNQKSLRIYGDNESEYAALFVPDTTVALGRMTVQGVGDVDKLELQGMSLYFINQVAANETIASRGQVWVDNSSPNQLIFTDDASTDWVLNNPDTLQYVTDKGNVTTNDIIVSGSSFRVRGLAAGALEEKRIYFEDSGGVAYFRIGTESNGDVEVRNLSEADSVRLMGTLAGGGAHTYLDCNPNSATRLRSNPGRDVAIGAGNLDYIFCDNLGLIDFFYAGSQNVARMTSVVGGGLLVNQTETGDSGVFRRALTIYDLGLDGEFWFFEFNAGTTDPTQQRFRFNNADPTLVTILTLDDLAISDRDPVDILGTIQAGTQIQLAQTTDLSIWAVYEATGPAVDNTTHFSIPVSYVNHNGTFPTATRPPFKFTFSNTAASPAAGGGGFAFDTFDFNFDTATAAADPGSGDLRLDNATPSSVTFVYISDNDSGGTDRTHALGKIGLGSTIRIESADDPTFFARYAINAITDNTTWWSFGASHLDSGGTLPANGEALKVLLEEAPHVENPSTSRSILRSQADPTGNAINGWIENTDIRTRGGGGALESGLEFYDNEGQVFDISCNNGTVIVEARDPLGAVGALRLRGDSVRMDNEGGSQPMFLLRNTVTDPDFWFGADSPVKGGFLKIREAAAATADTAAWGQLWVRNDTPNVLIFTDDAGTDHNLIDPGAVAQTITAGWSTGSGGSLTVAANTGIFYAEQAADDGPSAGQGQLWVRNDTPNTMVFTGDDSLDYVIPKRQFKVKTADETVNNSAAMQADDHLASFNLVAGKYYRVEALIRATIGTTPNLDIDLVFTNATQLGHKSVFTLNATAVGSQDITAIETEQNITGAAGEQLLKIEGFFQANATTGGTMELQWAQATATVEDTTLHEGSYMVVEQVEP